MGSKHDPERILFCVCLPSPYQTRIGRGWGGGLFVVGDVISSAKAVRTHERVEFQHWDDRHQRWGPHRLTTHSRSELECTEFHKQLAYALRWRWRRRQRRPWQRWQHLECALHWRKRGKQTILLSISPSLLLNTSKSVTLTEAPAR